MVNSSLLSTKRLQKFEQFKLITGASIGYRAREDQTLLRPGILVQGSKNVLTNTAGRVASVKGYTLDGAADTSISSILSSYDWRTAKGYERHLRAGFLTSAANDGKLQFRYVNSVGTVTWTDLLTGLTSTAFNFADFWDYNTEKIALLLFVNHSNKIYEWSGATTTFASATANTITKQGTTTWAEEGFYANGTRQVTINGTVYTYTGGEGTTTLTGVTPDPTLGSYAAGTLIFQTVRSTLNSAMTGLPLPINDLIGSNLNQVYVADLTLNDVYVSKTNNYKDYSVSSPRTPGQGAIFNLGSTPTAFVPQEDAMYISGVDEWYKTKFTLSSDLTSESLEVAKLQTSTKQSAKSQAFVTKDKNSVVFVSNEPTLSSFGPVQNIYQAPQILDLSFPVIDDFNDYDFTDGSSIYWKNYILVAVPQEGLIRIYNQTNPRNMYWEAPVTYPISRFSIIDGDLYGHGYLSSESYKLFEGYNFNGAEIESIATFSFDNFQNPSNSKGFNEYYVEGYITGNTLLYLDIQLDIDGNATNTSYEINGNDSAIVAIRTDSNSLGKNSLGKAGLGTNANPDPVLPPKFRVIKTMPLKYFFEEQTTFRSLGTDQQWEILRFGAKLVSANDLSTDIKQ